jgi:signal transduction histidine kinase
MIERMSSLATQVARMSLQGLQGAIDRMTSTGHGGSKEIDWEIPARIAPEGAGRVLLRLRWILAATLALMFALGQTLGGIVQGHSTTPQLAFDFAGDLIGGVAIWISLTWAYQQERQHQARIAHGLHAQQVLNRQLQRANDHLALLSEVNQHIAQSLTLDNILDAALAFSQRLVPVQAAALVLADPVGPVDARVVGAKPEELARLRAARATSPVDDQNAVRQMEIVPRIPHGTDTITTCVELPLNDGVVTEGWIELYLADGVAIADDELELLATIAGVATEAIVNARRRAREERAVYKLERAITEERARIARDIHDGIAQALAFHRMRIELWQDWIETDPDRLRAELGEFKQALREQIGELRRAIFALRPMRFDALGFVGGLHRYIIEFANQHGWEAVVDFHHAPTDLIPEAEAACFRIVQEALTNSAKHAAATRVTVTLDEADDGVRIVVCDNGRGFDPGEGANDTGHVGLQQMAERLATLRGQLTLLSRPGAGTEVRAWIPFALRRHEARLA